MARQECEFTRGTNLVEDVVFGLGVIGTALVIDGLDAVFMISEKVHPRVNALKRRLTVFIDALEKDVIRGVR